MCIGENDSPRFIRRRDAALAYMQQLLEQGGLLDGQVIGAVADKFCLNVNIRDDYRIYKALWNLLGG